jgi:hypothetical protein
MAFMTIEGMTVKASPGTFKELAPEPVGSVGPSSRGIIRRGERAHRRAWTCSVPFQLFAAGNALGWLLRGRGWTFSFEKGIPSDNGLNPNAGYTAVLRNSAPSPLFGARYMHINSSGGAVAWNATLPSFGATWSFGWWHNHNNTFPAANGWNHYFIVNDRYSYTGYLNGAVATGPSGSMPTTPGNYGVSVAGSVGTFSLLGKQVNGTNSANSYFMDAAILPYAASAAMVAARYAAGVGSAWTRLPWLTLSGDCVGGESIEVSATLNEKEFRRASIEGAQRNNAVMVQLRLDERTPY